MYHPLRFAFFLFCTSRWRSDGVSTGDFSFLLDLHQDFGRLASVRKVFIAGRYWKPRILQRRTQLFRWQNRQEFETSTVLQVQMRTANAQAPSRGAKTNRQSNSRRGLSPKKLKNSNGHPLPHPVESKWLNRSVHPDFLQKKSQRN